LRLLLRPLRSSPKLGLKLINLLPIFDVGGSPGSEVGLQFLDVSHHLMAAFLPVLQLLLLGGLRSGCLFLHLGNERLRLDKFIL
jgi:hypothetical protein